MLSGRDLAMYVANTYGVFVIKNLKILKCDQKDQLPASFRKYATLSAGFGMVVHLPLWMLHLPAPRLHLQQVD
jgi:hypothetical protein